ncbi:hypothetical protein GC173_11145 [bacterium]|nr:hypothetical protein [bacterium]
METENVQDLVERALENAIESLDLMATDDNLNRRLRETQEQCNKALVELRGYGHDVRPENWDNN